VELVKNVIVVLKQKGIIEQEKKKKHTIIDTQCNAQNRDT
jgi:hypothetical protein